MISAFVASYGYFVVFFGTLLEGETILLAAGFAAHRDLLDWRLVVLIAVIGATLGDQLAFLLGRWKGQALIQRFPALERRTRQVHTLLERYDSLFILTVRFIYGLRIAGPVILGSSKISFLRFTTLNVTGAILWAGLIAGIGYGLGHGINFLGVELKTIEEIVLVVILTSGLIFWLSQHMKKPIRDNSDTKTGI